jgi:hypothetical protein
MAKRLSRDAMTNFFGGGNFNTASFDFLSGGCELDEFVLVFYKSGTLTMTPQYR